MVSIIGFKFKFLASINFGAARAPEDHDKFVIRQVLCYTEGDTSLRKTIDSFAQMKYDDKYKLLLVICDGIIVGSGNDRPTRALCLIFWGLIRIRILNLSISCPSVKEPSSATWARCTLACTCVQVMSCRTWLL